MFLALSSACRIVNVTNPIPQHLFVFMMLWLQRKISKRLAFVVIGRCPCMNFFIHTNYHGPHPKKKNGTRGIVGCSIWVGEIPENDRLRLQMDGLLGTRILSVT